MNPRKSTLLRLVIAAVAIVLVLVVFAGGWLTGRLGIGSVVRPESLTEVERQRVIGFITTRFFSACGPIRVGSKSEPVIWSRPLCSGNPRRPQWRNWRATP